jgi:hypothetical protein
MKIQHNLKSIFKDKATLILRVMMAEPDKKWVTRELSRQTQVSLGLVSRILSLLESGGYALRTGRGANAYTKLSNIANLLNAWTENYDFSLNRTELLYSPESNVLQKITAFLNTNHLSNNFAVTLHTGANLVTSHVLTDNTYLYLNHPEFDETIFDMADRLGLKKLARGGNVFISHPYYKNSVFHGIQKIKGMKTVSNLQLFLDLFNFHPRGREHALKLKELTEREGTFFE